jgi:hypothetical protein
MKRCKYGGVSPLSLSFGTLDYLHENLFLDELDERKYLNAFA